MTISKATILSEVNRRCNRNLSNVTFELNSVLVDYSLDVETYCIEAYCSTVSGTAAYDLLSFPEPFRTMDAVKIGNEEPLHRIRTMEEYQGLIEEETAADWDEPEAYLVYNNQIYLYPTPDAVYTLTILASSIQQDEDNIMLPDYMIEMLIEGTCWKVYESLGLGNQQYAAPHLQNYVNFKQKFLALENKKASSGSAAYNDV